MQSTVSIIEDYLIERFDLYAFLQNVVNVRENYVAAWRKRGFFQNQ
jgi:hypothetical protein